MADIGPSVKPINRVEQVSFPSTNVRRKTIVTPDKFMQFKNRLKDIRRGTLAP